MKHVCPYIHQIEESERLQKHKIVDRKKRTGLQGLIDVKGVTVNLDSRVLEAAGQRYEGFVCDKVSKIVSDDYTCPAYDKDDCIHFNSSVTYHRMLGFLNKFLEVMK